MVYLRISILELYPLEVILSYLNEYYNIQHVVVHKYYFLQKYQPYILDLMYVDYYPYDIQGNDHRGIEKEY